MLDFNRLFLLDAVTLLLRDVSLLCCRLVGDGDEFRLSCSLWSAYSGVAAMMCAFFMFTRRFALANCVRSAELSSRIQIELVVAFSLRTVWQLDKFVFLFSMLLSCGSDNFIFLWMKERKKNQLAKSIWNYLWCLMTPMLLTMAVRAVVWCNIVFKFFEIFPSAVDAVWKLESETMDCLSQPNSWVWELCDKNRKCTAFPWVAVGLPLFWLFVWTLVIIQRWFNGDDADGSEQMMSWILVDSSCSLNNDIIYVRTNRWWAPRRCCTWWVKSVRLFRRCWRQI